MNRDLIKGIVIFGIGAGIGYGVANTYLKNKYEAIIKDEIESLREAATTRERRMSRNDFDENGMQHKRYDEDGRVIPMNRDRYNKIVRRYNQHDAETATDLSEPSSFNRAMSDDEVEYRRFEKISNHDGHQDVEYSYPHVITIEQFNEENDHFDKLTISYYEDDDTLTDENDELISDREQVIGADALRSFGMGSEDPEVVYVRNESMRIDFEVIRLSKSYAQTVLGEEPVVIEKDEPKDNGQVKRKRKPKEDRRRDPDEE